MQIRALSITNFCGLDSFEIADAANVVLLTGLNATGKTTVLNAIRFLLQAPCYDQAGTRLTQAELVGPYAEKAVVQATVEHDGKTHTMTASTGAKGQTERNIKLADILGAEHGVPEREHRIGLTPAAWLYTGEIQEALLYSLLTHEDIEAVWPEFSEDIRFGLETFDARDEYELATLRDMGDQAYKLRRDNKKRAGEIESSIPQFEAPKTKGGTVLTEEHRPKLQARISELRAKRDKLLRASGDPEQIQQQLDELEPELPTLIEFRDTAKRQYEQARVAYNSLHERVQALNIATDDATRALNEVSRLQDQLDNLSEEAVCEHCGQTLPQEIVEKMKHDITAHLDQAENHKAECDEALRNAEAAVKESAPDTEVEVALDNFQDRISEAQQAFTEADRRVQSTQAKIDQLRSQLENAVPADDSGDTVETLEERIKNGEDMLSGLDNVAEKESKLQEAAEIRAIVERQNRIVSYLRSDQLLKKLGLDADENDALGRVNSVLSAVIGTLTNHEGELWLQRKGREEVVPLRRVSDSERVCLEFAVAAAFAAPYGIPVLVDRLEALDGKDRPTLLSVASNTPGSYWFAAASQQPKCPDLEKFKKAFPNASIVWMGNS